MPTDEPTRFEILKAAALLMGCKNIEFLKTINNYEERKVDNFTKDGVMVDTVSIDDSDKPFETGIAHPFYNNGKWIIVELYNSKEEAQIGHNKWVKIMTSENPIQLIDVSTSKTKPKDENRIFERKPLN